MIQPSQSERDRKLLLRIRLAADELNEQLARAAAHGLRVEMHTVNLEAETGSFDQYYFNAYRKIEVEDNQNVPRQPNQS